MKKPKKYNLECEYEQEFEVLGLCSHYPDYRLIWNVNTLADLQLAKSDKVFENYSKKGALLSTHEKYTFYDDITETNFVLVKNKTNTHYIAPEYTQVDYLLFLYSEKFFDIVTLKSQLLKGEAIVAALIIDLATCPSLDNINPMD